MIAILAAAALAAAPPAVFVDEAQVISREPPPHNGKGMSTAYHLSSKAPGRTMEFRKRVLHRGATIGPHRIDHDEVYYVLSGEGEVTANGVKGRVKTGGAAYLYAGSTVGIEQRGDQDLALVIAYPIRKD